MKKLVTAIAMACAVAAAGSAAAAPVFNFQFTAGTSIEAQQGFIAAAARWSSVLTDNVTINLTVGFNPLGDRIIGETHSALLYTDYSDVRGALVRDATSHVDAIATSNLPSTATFGVLTNRTANNPHGAGSAKPYLDNNGGFNNAFVTVTSAEAKAAGLGELPQSLAGCIGTCDGFIRFNSDFNFDFNPHDGVRADAFDFIGVAAHEIGHALGFSSGVDDLDFVGTLPELYADDAFLVSGLDLFRFSEQSAALGVIDWTADKREKYFSIDGGVTAIAPFSTGREFGDGNQASHWLDDKYIGLMDPTAGLGEVLTISQEDLVAMDAIGWDVSPVPEPSTYAMLGAGLMLLGGRAARKSARKSTTAA